MAETPVVRHPGFRKGVRRGVVRTRALAAFLPPDRPVLRQVLDLPPWGAAQRRFEARGTTDTAETFPVASDDSMTASAAGRYASALFDLAKDQGKLADVERDLVNFQALLDGSDDLRRMVLSPVYSSEDQGKAVAAIAAKAGIGGLAANFLKLLARNRRLFAVGEMIKAYRTIAARARGEMTAEVASAHALTDAQLQALKDTLKASLGKDVNIQAKVDPGLLGGLVVKVGSRMIDSSLKTKLDSLKVAMKGTG
jgi:F-type H+-transporting ATPase subunit delta